MKILFSLGQSVPHRKFILANLDFMITSQKLEEFQEFEIISPFPLIMGLLFWAMNTNSKKVNVSYLQLCEVIATNSKYLLCCQF